MNEDNKRRLEHQLYLASENPEPTYDVSKCGLTMVPQGCYSLCKVLRKKKLFLNNNFIKMLNSNGNNVDDLTVLTHLYLEFNEITTLPNNIDSIQYLQVLNISNNKLIFIPPSIGNLPYLSQLLVRNNQIKELPSTIFNSKSNLEVIDISENSTFSLIPISIMHLSKLRKFEFSPNYLIFPSQDVCQKGLVEIITVLCKTDGVSINQSFLNQMSNNEENKNDVVDISILDYENFKKNRLEFLRSVEDEFEQVISSQKLFADKALHERMLFFSKLSEEEAKITNEINKMQCERDLRRQQLIYDVKAAEADAANLIEEIMTISRACQKQEKILDDIENEAMKKYHLYEVSKNEFENLRRQEILIAMSQILISQETAYEILQHRKGNQYNLMHTTMSNLLNDKTLSKIINERLKTQNKIISKLEKEESEQKLAFQQLQIQKDIRSLRLTEHIYSVESELIMLSQAEQKKRAEKIDFKFNVLNERRQQLVEMLEHLIQQKALRERVLKQRMLEMEEQRLKDQDDFWLIQYQRCLDMKPHCLWNDSNLDILVKELLSRVNATEYLPFFLRYNISWDEVKQFQENDWENVGIHNKILRKNLLDTVKKIKNEQEKKIKKKENFEFNEINEVLKESHIPESQPIVMTSHRETECCICLNEETTILFMGCGHICCCDACSKNLKECPLCRNEITRIIKLMCW